MNKVNEVIEAVYAKNSKIKIVAVTKKKLASDVLKISKLNINNFGENYVQEAQNKISFLKEYNFNWHFIGGIQSKKLNQIVGSFSLIHSVDRLKLIKKIDDLSYEKEIKQEILLQVNTSNELSKGGFEKSEIDEAIGFANKCKNINLKGLMCMPSPLGNLTNLRQEFKDLKNILENNKLKVNKGHGFTELSMGTSADYMLAIEEGATIIRLGRVLLGERP